MISGADFEQEVRTLFSNEASQDCDPNRNEQNQDAQPLAFQQGLTISGRFVSWQTHEHGLRLNLSNILGSGRRIIGRDRRGQ
jgi:outer membrane biogenesis lipoprotein LolB